MLKVLIACAILLETVCAHAFTPETIDLNYRTYGNASNEPLVLIHGLGDNLDTWRFVLPKLIKDFYVITYDQRGHGTSSSELDDYSLWIMSHDLRALLEKLNITHAHILGHSFGGRTAMQFAKDHPQFVRSLIIEDMDPFFRGRRSKTDLASCLEWGVGSEFYAQCAYSYHASVSDFRVSLKDLRAPLLFMSAAIEVGLTDRDKVRISERIPNAHLEVIPGSDHTIHYSAPHFFVSTLKRFLGRQ